MGKCIHKVKHLPFHLLLTGLAFSWGTTLSSEFPLQCYCLIQSHSHTNCWDDQHGTPLLLDNLLIWDNFNGCNQNKKQQQQQRKKEKKRSPVLFWLKNCQWPAGNQSCGNMIPQENWPRMLLLSEVKDREVQAMACSSDWREKCQLRNGLKRHLNQVATCSQGPEIPKRNNLAMTLNHYSTREPAKQLNHKTKIQDSLPIVGAEGWEHSISCMENKRREQASKSKTKCIRNKINKVIVLLT